MNAKQRRRQERRFYALSAKVGHAVLALADGVERGEVNAAELRSIGKGMTTLSPHTTSPDFPTAPTQGGEHGNCPNVKEPAC